MRGISLWISTVATDRIWILLPGLFCIIISIAAAVTANDLPGSEPSSDFITVGHFSKAELSQALPDGWSPLFFDSIQKHTRYTLVREDNGVSLKAESHAAASGISKMLTVDLASYPVLEWRWKVTRILKKGNMRTRRGNDSPAQLSVKFGYVPEKTDYWIRMKYNFLGLIRKQPPPVAAIIYFWGSQLPKESVITSPYADRVKLIAVESGESGLNEWRTKSRNVFQDYRLAFGGPPPPVMCVAIMTDTDNTSESAVTYYGDIFFRRLKHNNPP